MMVRQLPCDRSRHTHRADAGDHVLKSGGRWRWRNMTMIMVISWTRRTLTLAKLGYRQGAPRGRGAAARVAQYTWRMLRRRGPVFPVNQRAHAAASRAGRHLCAHTREPRPSRSPRGDGGYSAVRSGVTVSSRLHTSSASIPLAATIASSSSRAALTIASAVFASTLIAPRTPRQRAGWAGWAAVTVSLLHPVSVAREQQKGRRACALRPVFLA